MFKVGRCHLSEKFSDGPFVEIIREPEKCDLQLPELSLKGAILIQCEDGSRREWRFDLPADWITHEIREDDAEESQAVAVPVQRW